ncbi:hypothetical protein [Mycolicibacterium nivoides]|uniref:Uncharacterized protein n=1 Tax=Mycolicibacterium nivoides TaxID=2487344 RepID=A0ABW9LJY5_9MYCO
MLDGIAGIQDNPEVMVALGAVGALTAITLLRLLRRVRRMIWTAAVLAAASGAGAGGGWAVLDALKIWH